MTLDFPPVKVFKLKKSGSALTVLYVVLLIAATLGMLYATVYAIVDGVLIVLVLTLPALLLFGVAMWAKLEELTNKLVIESDKFVHSNVFGTWRIDFGEMKGYRMFYRDMINRTDRTIEIHSEGKIISLNENINDFGILLDWLKKHFPNMATLTKAVDTKEMMENPAIGGNKEEKTKYIENARMVSYGVNGLGLIAAVSLFMMDTIYTVAAAIMVLPLCIIVVVYYKGIVYYNNKTDSTHPYVGLGLLAVSFGIFGKGILMSFALVSFSTVPWLYITLIALGLGSIILLTTKEFAKRTSMDIGNVVAIFFALWLMSLGSYFVTNQVMDKSIPKEIMTIVTGKTPGKNVDYVDFEPAGEVTDKQTDVDADVYERIEKGDTIVLRVFPGRWGSKWYKVRVVGK